MKYLIKQQVNLNCYEVSEDETEKPTDEKGWGVEEHDDVRVMFLIHVMSCPIITNDVKLLTPLLALFFA